MRTYYKKRKRSSGKIIMVKKLINQNKIQRRKNDVIEGGKVHMTIATGEICLFEKSMNNVKILLHCI
jgi:hypothetical protein